MAAQIPEEIRGPIQAGAHVGLSLAFTSRGLTVPNEEITEEAAAVTAAIEPFVLVALNKARFAEVGSFGIYDDCPLTDNELRVIAMRAQGMGRSEISEELGVSESAINSRLDKATKRIPGCRNQMHAMAVAIRAGWV